MNSKFCNIQGSTISDAWFESFNFLLERGVKSLEPMYISIKVNKSTKIDNLNKRHALDKLLDSKELYSTNTTANLIFPKNLWNPQLSREYLFERYIKILPSLKKADRRNKFGTYFERLIHYNQAESQFSNQLNHIIETYERGNHRRSALQASIFHPNYDHSHQRQRGFPCLQHVFSIPSNKVELSVTGVYATQYIFDRAYGNYLGLYRLGQFMAKEMNLKLACVNCFVASGRLGSITKEEGRAFSRRLEKLF